MNSNNNLNKIKNLLADCEKIGKYYFKKIRNR